MLCILLLQNIFEFLQLLLKHQRTTLKYGTFLYNKGRMALGVSYTSLFTIRENAKIMFEIWEVRWINSSVLYRILLSGSYSYVSLYVNHNFFVLKGSKSGKKMSLSIGEGTILVYLIGVFYSLNKSQSEIVICLVIMDLLTIIEKRIFKPMKNPSGETGPGQRRNVSNVQWSSFKTYDRSIAESTWNRTRYNILQYRLARHCWSVDSRSRGSVRRANAERKIARAAFWIFQRCSAGGAVIPTPAIYHGGKGPENSRAIYRRGACASSRSPSHRFGLLFPDWIKTPLSSYRAGFTLHFLTPKKKKQNKKTYVYTHTHARAHVIITARQRPNETEDHCYGIVGVYNIMCTR